MSMGEELFGTPKLFIKPIGKPEADWKELVGPIVSDSITISEKDDDAPALGYQTRHVFTATIRISRKNRIKLLQSVGLMKRPKCTYRTVKRNCAKRNRIK